MPSSLPPDLEGYLVERLCPAVGADSAREALAEAKKAANIAAIASVPDLVQVARVLAGRDGYVGIVGDLIAHEAERWSTD